MKMNKINDRQPFYVGQEVICINDNFPLIRTTGSDKSQIGSVQTHCPKLNEELVVDEILGPFIRFNKIDHNMNEVMWWHANHFISKAEFRLKEVMREKGEFVQSDNNTNN